MIFNSLGSNYNLRFVFRSLFSLNRNRYCEDLKTYLSQKYNGEIVLLHKGREAVKLALDFLGLSKGSKVGINGFTCYVVDKAITDAGYKPEYFDIDADNLNFPPSFLKKKNGVKALIIQNTFGNPCPIKKIKRFCRENKVCLIEDLAHSLGTKYLDGKKAGSYGDFVVLSFSRDKIVDAISGGALIVRNKQYRHLVKTVKLKNLSLKTQIQERFYPFLTFVPRETYSLGLGKVLHLIFKKLNWLSSPVPEREKINYQKMPDWYCHLANLALDKFDQNLRHRKEIAEIYANNIDRHFLSRDVVSNLARSSNIRFPIFVRKRQDLINYLKKEGIYVSDIWYDAPIAPKKFLNLTAYRGECPVAESLSQKIINLPTHINVSKKKALFIANKINIWLKSQ